MLTLINIYIHDVELDLVLVHLFHFKNDWDKNAILFGGATSSSVHASNKNKDTLILGKGETNTTHNNTTLVAEAEYYINFSRLRRKCSFMSSI